MDSVDVDRRELDLMVFFCFQSEYNHGDLALKRCAVIR